MAWLISFSFFTAMWAVGWSSNNYWMEWETITFSEMLENVPMMKLLYGIWYWIYFVVSVVIVFLVGSYTLKETHLEGHTKWRNLLSLCTACYMFCIFFKLIGLAGVPFFDVDSTYNYYHGISAATAFITGELACWFLFFRRLIIAWHFGDPSDVAYYYFSRVALVFNFIWLLAGLSTIIGFAITIGGAWEFFLSLFIVMDVLWQIGDFGADSKSSQRYGLL